MTIEHRTLIELTDITGIEFECQHCTAKVLYPFENNYKRLAENCPNCNETWLSRDDKLHPGAPQTVDGVRELISDLRKVASSPFVRAHVRLYVDDASSKNPQK